MNTLFCHLSYEDARWNPFFLPINISQMNLINWFVQLRQDKLFLTSKKSFCKNMCSCRHGKDSTASNSIIWLHDDIFLTKHLFTSFDVSNIKVQCNNSLIYTYIIAPYNFIVQRSCFKTTVCALSVTFIEHDVKNFSFHSSFIWKSLTIIQI